VTLAESYRGETSASACLRSPISFIISKSTLRENRRIEPFPPSFPPTFVDLLHVESSRGCQPEGVLVSLIVADYRSGRALAATRQGKRGEGTPKTGQEERCTWRSVNPGLQWKLITADPCSTGAALVSASLSVRGRSCVDSRSRNASLHGNAEGGFMGKRDENRGNFARNERGPACSIRRARVRMVGPSLRSDGPRQRGVSSRVKLGGWQGGRRTSSRRCVSRTRQKSTVRRGDRCFGVTADIPVDEESRLRRAGHGRSFRVNPRIETAEFASRLALNFGCLLSRCLLHRANYTG
jgi:hypothetical protein